MVTSQWGASTAPSRCRRRCSSTRTARSPGGRSDSSTNAASRPSSRPCETSLRMSSVVLFRRVSVLTAVFAYLQIALGGVVRVSGSGLGCPDWPLCQGRPYPPANLNAIIEYSHRTVGAITGVLIIATVVAAWTVFRTKRPAVAWLATASVIAVAVEGALGGVVVVSELK